MKTSGMFTPTRQHVDELVRAHPLAQVISTDGTGSTATPLPILLERNAADGNDWLIGHFARSNPQIEMLRESPIALFIFMGPHGYVSPSWFDDRTQAPTWNFCTAHFEANVEFLDDQESAFRAVQQLTEHMETGRKRAWRVEELGCRRGRLLPAIVPFRARVKSEVSKFKLGQNERPDICMQIINAFNQQGQGALSDRMRAANAGRLMPARQS